MALSVKHDLSLHQVYVITAFLNGTLDDKVYMQQSKGFECQGRKSLYLSLTIAATPLLELLLSNLKEMQFSLLRDPYIYFWKKGNHMVFIGVYIDDIILGSKNENNPKQVKKKVL